MPHFQLRGTYLNIDLLNLIYFAYIRYRHDERPLLREEVCGIVGVRLKKPTPRTTDASGVLNIFDDPRDPLSEKHHGLTAGIVQGLETEVKTYLVTYLEHDAEAKARSIYLRGL